MPMEPEKPSARSIWLWEEDEDETKGEDGFRPWLDPYPISTKHPLGAVLVCPGGGYRTRAPHECAPIAERFNRAGFHAFVVHYRVTPRNHPAPIRDASRAIRMIRHNAQRWNVAPERVAVCGFSAGGHLAASLGVHYDREFLKGSRPLDQASNRPDALILCYAVLSTGEYGPLGCFKNLLGPEPSQEELRLMSLELQATERTPPAFLWHTVEDATVPVENSVIFAKALRRHGVPFELHLYPKGRHGLGLAAQDEHVASWMTLCCQWLRAMGWPAAS
ncbi:MAG: alpha/beta hydrolase [Candidatus Sumerlaeota bacterium]|nr:alpha/beta hydrolase [Candidatus Sumerlaeota bacterium]